MQSIPANMFQCGVQSESTDHVAKEAIRTILHNGFESLGLLDKSSINIIDTYIEESYSEKTTGNDFFQFSYGGSTDPTLRYTFAAASNLLRIAPPAPL